VDGVIAAKPDKFVRQIATVGWQIKRAEDLWFCFGKRMVGAPAGSIEYESPRLIARSRAKHFSESGTLDEWRSRIASKALLSTCLTVGISAAFAAPLIRASGLQNFTLHVFAEARAGKTTTLLAATSVYGVGHEEKLKNWNSSGSVELLEAAAGFGDIVFPLNEVGAAKGKRTQTYEVLRDLYAQYAEGGDRNRHSTWETAHGGEAKQFRGICISTAEHSIADYAAKAGETRDKGELFRAIDVIAVREGMKTILDRAPETLNQRNCLQKLRDDLKLFHGTAAPHYIEYLTRTGPSKVKRRVRSLMDEFVDRMPAAAHDGVARQMAMNLGLLYAGGIMGIDSGVLPWSKNHLRRALTQSFADAFEHCKVVDPLTMALDILKANLRDKIAERKLGSRFGVKAHPGFWSHIGGQKTVVVHTRQFGAWFANKPQRDLALDWLATNGALKRTTAATKSALTPADTIGVLRRWPDGTLVRSFEFADPFAAVSAPQALLTQQKVSLNKRLKLNKRRVASKAAIELDPESWPVDENGRRVYAN
jgi:hypothetical protein